MKDAIGYIIYRSDKHPEHHRGYSLKLNETGPPIKEGDLIILRHKLYSPKREYLLTNRVWKAKGVAGKFSQPMLGSLSNDENSAQWELVKHPPKYQGNRMSAH